MKPEFREPWTLDPHFGPCGYIRDNTGEAIVGGYGDDGCEPNKEQIERIVACVNALAGIPTETINRLIEINRRGPPQLSQLLGNVQMPRDDNVIPIPDRTKP